jgi:hypothetical protein
MKTRKSQNAKVNEDENENENRKAMTKKGNAEKWDRNVILS